MSAEPAKVSLDAADLLEAQLTNMTRVQAVAARAVLGELRALRTGERTGVGVDALVQVHGQLEQATEVVKNALSLAGRGGR